MTSSWQARAAEYCQRLGGKPRVRKPYRCGACRARRSLHRELWQYEQPPRCNCGACDWRLDWHRTVERLRRAGPFETCHCDGVYHPHRIASTVWCREHPTGPSEEDYRERYGSYEDGDTTTEGLADLAGETEPGRSGSK